MSDNTRDGKGSIELDDRTRRGLEEPLSVVTLDGTPVADREATIVQVVSHSGEAYTVDVREGRCTCPDAEYNLDSGEACKHEVRARIALGREPLDAAVLGAVDVDAQLGASAPGPVIATADGGIVRPDEGAEVLETDSDDVDPWAGPFDETDKYGCLTGTSYVRCRDCGVEAVTSVDTETVAHRDGCRFGDEGADEEVGRA
jgi:hypothetical protein